MGTSSTYGGPGPATPLVPTWLEPFGPEGEPAATPDGDPDRPPTGPENPPVPPPPEAPRANRFRSSRANFSRYAGSGGGGRAGLGRALSGYVTTASGGARNAARRMGSSRAAGANLLGFLSDVRDRGVRETLRALNLEALAGRPLEDIFLGIRDYICPEGGGVDEGIACDAFIETVADLSDLGITDLDGLTPDQMCTIFELYTAHSIEARIYNDIGVKGVALPDDVGAVVRIQDQLHDFLRGAVSDAVSSAREALRGLTRDRVAGFVRDIYVSAFEMLRALGEAEAKA